MICPSPKLLKEAAITGTSHARDVSPCHISFGAIADRYITVDFTGRRLFTLVETESARWSDYIWNDGKRLYNVYRETIDFGNIESISIWYNNLPENKNVNCILGPVKALPMLDCSIKNPRIKVNSKIIVFPVETNSGSYLEFYGNDNCILYGAKGETLMKVIPKGSVPLLLEGKNQIRFSCDQTEGPAARGKVTVISYGESL